MLSFHRSARCLPVVAITWIAVLSPAIAWGQFRIPEEAQDAYEAAEQLFSEQKYDEAIGKYTEAIQLTQENYPEALLGRGKAFAAIKDYQSSLSDLKKTTDLDVTGQLHEVYNVRGKIFLEAGAPSEALNDFNKAVESDRMNPEYLGNQGRAMAQLGMAQQALTILDRAIERYEATPDLAVPSEIYVARGQAYMAFQDYPKAFDAMNKAVEVDPQNYKTYYVYGVFQMQAMEHEAAVDSFTKAAEFYTPERPTDPPYVEPYLGASLAYIEIGKEASSEDEKVAAYEAAVAECDKAIEKTLETQRERPFALFNRGVALRLLGRYGDAIKAFTETMQLSPDFGEAYFRRGIVWHNLEEYGLAIGDFEQASTINYEDVRSYLWLGFAHAAKENYIEAINAYSKAIHQDPRYAPAYTNRGLAYVMIEDFEKAIDNFNGAIRLEPMEPMHYYRRGAAQMMFDQLEDAVVSFSVAIEFAPDFVDAFQMLAECHEQLGNTELAEDARKKVDELKASTSKTTESEKPDASASDPVPSEQ
jgi:tetratricopeptide (TPR) repeat protein